MALPTNKADFIEYCLRQLGKPVIQINMSPEQISDAYDEAILYFQENHMDGSERMFYKFTVDQDFINTRTKILPQSILSVKEIITIPSSATREILFDYQFQMTSEILWNMFKGGTAGLFDFALMRQQLREIQFNTIGETSYVYNRHTGKLQIDLSAGRFAEGNIVLAVVNNMIDPETNPGIFRDSWLISYTCALLKLRWASNMQKFQGVALPGGVTMNGSEIYQQALQERQRLEEEIIDKWNMPIGMLIG